VFLPTFDVNNDHRFTAQLAAYIWRELNKVNPSLVLCRILDPTLKTARTLFFHEIDFLFNVHEIITNAQR
jgi:hypothetical protein